MAHRVRARYFVSLGLVTVACVTDHDALEKRMSGAGGAGGNGGSAGTHVIPPMGGSGGMAGQVGTPRSVLPDGDSLLTFVHGQVDAERVAFCFAKLSEDGLEAARDAPSPKGGLGYGQHLSFDAPGGLSLKDDDIVPIVLAGDQDALDVESCEAAIQSGFDVGVVQPPMGEGGGAGASDDELDPPPTPNLRFQRLPLLTQGTLDRGRNTLLVLSGCMGAATHSHDDEEALCGVGYQPQRSSLTLLVGVASRQTSAGKLGLQFMHASLATAEVNVLSLAALAGSPDAVPLATSVLLGHLSPHSIDLSRSAGQYEVENGGRLEVIERGERRLQQSFEALRELAEISTPSDGKAYTAVLIGPGGGRSKGDWWNAATLTLVANEPE
jgi:hypothetical protein